MTADRVWLLASCDRYLYKNIIYQTLAVPSGYVLHYPYRERWVANELGTSEEELEGLEGTPAVVAAALSTDMTNLKIPLRFGEIYSIEYEESVYHVYVKLRDEILSRAGLFANPDKSPQERSKIRPHLNVDSEIKEFLSVESSNGRMDETATMEDCWADIVGLLGNTQQFDNGLFLRLKNMRERQELSANTNLGSPEKIDQYSRGFKLQAEREYSLEMVCNFGSEPPAEASSSLMYLEGTDATEIYPKEIPLGFHVDKKQLTIRTGSVSSHSLEFIRIQFNGAVEGAQFRLPFIIGKWEP